MEEKLQPGIPFTLADAIVMVRELSECTTSHPAIRATPVNHGANGVPPNAANVPMPIGLEPMDLTVAHVNSGCHCCNGCGHEARKYATLDTVRRPQACHTSTGGNRARRDGGRDRTETCRGGRGSVARSVTGGMNNVEVAAVVHTCIHDDGEDSAVEQEVEDEEEGQGNGNWV